MTSLKEDEKIVWMIDDDRIQHFCVEKSLRAQGIMLPIKSFFNGEEAINYFTQNLNNRSLLPDIILLDLNMPLLNGWEFLQQYTILIEKLHDKKPTKIFLLTSSIDKGDFERAASITEISGFQSKPLTPEDIQKIMGDY